MGMAGKELAANTHVLAWLVMILTRCLLDSPLTVKLESRLDAAETLIDKRRHDQPMGLASEVMGNS